MLALARARRGIQALILPLLVLMVNLTFYDRFLSLMVDRSSSSGSSSTAERADSAQQAILPARTISKNSERRRNLPAAIQSQAAAARRARRREGQEPRRRPQRQEEERLKDHNHRLSHVVIPLHEKQLDALRTNLLSYWVAHPPCRAANPPATTTTATEEEHDARRPALVFHVSLSVSQSLRASEGEKEEAARRVRGIREQCRRTFEELPLSVRQCFANATHSVYPQVLRRQSDRHFRGARLLWENLLRGRVTKAAASPVPVPPAGSSSSYALYMEPDVVPVQSRWLEHAQNQVAWPAPEFWVRGSIFRGDVALVNATTYLPGKYHINGNAIYNVGSRAFFDWYFRRLRPHIAAKHQGDSYLAYDTDLYEYLHAPELYDAHRHLMHYFQYTDLIQNMWHTDWSARTVVLEHPNTVLVHGGNDTDRPPPLTVVGNSNRSAASSA